jgi:hypothetical protein
MKTEGWIVVVDGDERVFVGVFGDADSARAFIEEAHDDPLDCGGDSYGDSNDLRTQEEFEADGITRTCEHLSTDDVPNASVAYINLIPGSVTTP